MRKVKAAKADDAKTGPSTSASAAAAVLLPLSRAQKEEEASKAIAAMADETQETPLAAPDQWEEDRSCAVFHVMPCRPKKGRTKRAAETDQAALWAHVAPGLAWDGRSPTVTSAVEQ